MGVGPDPNGRFSNVQIQRLKEIGDWLKVNGEAIYNTRTNDLYQDGNTFFTRSKTGKKIYAMVLVKEEGEVPAFVEWSDEALKNISRIKLMSTGRSVKWKTEGGKIRVSVPSDLRKGTQSNPALVFLIEQ